MAFGTLAFDTLSTSGQISGTALSVDADYLAYGSAKARVTGSAAAAIATGQSFNISSGTDHGTGDYSYAFINNLDSASYTGAVAPHGGGLRLATSYTVRNTTGVFAIYVGTSNSAVSDHGHCGAAFGDLA